MCLGVGNVNVQGLGTGKRLRAMRMAWNHDAEGGAAHITGSTRGGGQFKRKEKETIQRYALVEKEPLSQFDTHTVPDVLAPSMTAGRVNPRPHAAQPHGH